MTPIWRPVSFLAVAALALGSRGWAGEKKDESGKPGKEHKLLSTLEGKFEVKSKLYLDPSKGPEESTGTMERKMIMGGRFLQERFEGKVFGQPFYGMGIIGYDPAKKKFTMVWVDSMSTNTVLNYGDYDAAKKTFTFTGDEIDPMTGKKMKTRDVFKLVGTDEQHTEMFRQYEGDAKEFKMLDITMKRKK